MIRVLVVEDSPVVREFLVHILNSDSEIRVVGTASDGEEAVRAVARWKPDVITMDIHMPRRNGFEATRTIMQTHPTPIVIVTGSSNVDEVATAFHVLEAGALAAVPRPSGLGRPDHEATAKEIVRTVKLMSEVKVVRRWARPRRASIVSGPAARLAAPTKRSVPREIKLVAMGASTGGPLAIQAILSALPKDFPVPVLVVQHMAAGFVEGFVEWLSQASALPTLLAADRQLPLPGHAYIAPDGFHMKVRLDGTLSLSNDERVNGLRPAVSQLLRSVAQVYGPQAIGVLLTGMGKDGAEELKSLHEQGAITIAQDRESSIVHGMPGEAIALGAATYVLPPNQIALLLASLLRKSGSEREEDPWTPRSEPGLTL